MRARRSIIDCLSALSRHAETSFRLDTMAASVTITPQLLSGLTNVAYGAQLLGLGPKQLGKSSFGESFEVR